MTRIGVNYEDRPSFNAKFVAANGAAPPLDVDRIFCQTESWPSGNYTDVIASVKAGHTPIVSTKLSGSWADAANGSNDARLDGIVNGLTSLNISGLQLKPYFTVHHEPEGDGDPADYNRLYRHLVPRNAPKLRAAGWEFCYIWMGGTFSGWTKWTVAQMEQASTGVDIKDHFADLYEKPGGSTPYATKAWMDPANTSSPFNRYHAYCQSKGYREALPELGVNRMETDAVGTSQSGFLEALARWPGSDAYIFTCYYDRNVGEGGATSNCDITWAPQPYLPQRAYAGVFNETIITPVPEPEPEPEPLPEPEPTPDPRIAELEARVAELEAQVAQITNVNRGLEGDLLDAQNKLDGVKFISEGVRRPSSQMKQIIAIVNE